jgi:lysyl-tRNA synthetase class 2
VRFIDGDEYAYVGVPGEVHRSFVDAESKGGFFASEIRGRYPYNKLT